MSPKQIPCMLHLCFDNITEYDPDVVFDKNLIFLSFFMKPTFIQVLIKTMLEARIKQFKLE